MKTGLDRILTDYASLLKGKRVGLLAHAASVNSSGKHILDLFLQQKVNLVKLFGPEHGLWGKAEDMEGVESTKDPKTGLPVKSLYGSTLDSLKPKPEDLSGIDVLVCDLQDIGSRYYTYAATLALCMQTAAQTETEVLVLDRPNPLNGVTIEGKILKPGFESFVGLYPLPIRHGMTIGEMARYFNEEQKIGCELEVIPMEGWKRKLFFDETGLPWVNPSPNMRSVEAEIVYPGICLIEATNLSEGRGTPSPFLNVGAPFIEGRKLADEMNKMGLKGISFKPTRFTPDTQKWAGQICEGVSLTITDRKKFKPVLTGAALLREVIRLYPKDFAWRDQPYEFVSTIPAIDLLSGDTLLREQLEAGTKLEEITADWEEGWDNFLSKREKYIIYQ